MPVREGPPQPAPPKEDPADNDQANKVRGGEILLRTRLQRAIFIAGLGGAVLLALLLQLGR